VTGLDTSDHTARARVRVRDGSVQVVTCTVEPAAPHRITATQTMALIPSFLTQRLPTDFTGYPHLAGCGPGARLIVFSGLPATGKSTLAEAAGRHLRAPVFAVDWLLRPGTAPGSAGTPGARHPRLARGRQLGQRPAAAG
jgi:hypothetical protein